jgi:hypothetical protein
VVATLQHSVSSATPRLSFLSCSLVRYQTDMKFHVEHFTCSVCPTVFGPQDSYYEHGGDVFCHFHYSTRFAVKCTGCRTAILKQFVEINRNSTDEHWHVSRRLFLARLHLTSPLTIDHIQPECYMISKVIKHPRVLVPRVCRR